MISDAKAAVAERLLAVVRWTLWAPWRLAAVVCAIVVALVIVGQLRADNTAARPEVEPTPDIASNWPRATAQPNEGAGSSPAASSPASSPAASSPPNPEGRVLSGEALAKAWLAGYLDRSSRDDDSWSAAIADITDPQLLTALEAEGPDAVGLFKFQSWRVTQVRPSAGSKPVDTPSRQVLAYTATVTDGERTERKPFVLYCYGSADGRWLVTLVEQPYTSEG